MNMFVWIAIANPSLYEHVLYSAVVKSCLLVEYRDIYRLYFELCSWLILWSRVLLERLTVTQLVKFYGIRQFIAIFTGARHWIPSWIRRVQFTSLHPVPSRPISVPFRVLLCPPVILSSFVYWVKTKSCTAPVCTDFSSLSRFHPLSSKYFIQHPI
jgi:hypothetical protein